MLTKIVKENVLGEITRRYAENILDELKKKDPIGDYYIDTESVPHKWKEFEEYYDYVERSIIKRYTDRWWSQIFPKKIAEIRMNRWDFWLYFESFNQKLLPEKEMNEIIMNCSEKVYK